MPAAVGLGRVHQRATCVGRPALPAAGDTISAYLTELARHGAKVGTMSRRLSSIRFAHQLRDLPDPTTGARIVYVAGTFVADPVPRVRGRVRHSLPVPVILGLGLGLVVVKWPLFFHDKPWTLTEGVVNCLLVALSILAFLGIRYPVQMLPVLLFDRYGS